MVSRWERDPKDVEHPLGKREAIRGMAETSQTIFT
jgi:hypothetical protein